jgi:hypothetical protein
MAHEIRWFEGEIYIVDARRVERLANQLDKLYHSETNPAQP